MPSTHTADSINPFHGPEAGDLIRFSDHSYGYVRRSNAGWYVEDRHGEYAGRQNPRVGAHPYLAEFAEALRTEDRQRKREEEEFAARVDAEWLDDD